MGQIDPLENNLADLTIEGQFLCPAVAGIGALGSHVQITAKSYSIITPAAQKLIELYLAALQMECWYTFPPLELTSFASILAFPQCRVKNFA
jgi:hypothetical protein